MPVAPLHLVPSSLIGLPSSRSAHATGSAEAGPSATALRTSARRHALSSTTIFDLRGAGVSTASLQPGGRRCYATTATTSTQASTPTATPSAAGSVSASWRSKQPRHHQVIDLGNSLSVVVPVVGRSPTPSSPRHHRDSRRHHSHTRSKATRRHRHSAPHVSTSDGRTEASAADGAVRAHSQHESKQTPQDRTHPRQATSSLLLPSPHQQQHDTQGTLETNQEGLLRIPRTAAEAVALLECATVLEALEASSLSRAPPRSATPAAGADNVRANFEELQNRALPLLFHLAQTAATPSASGAAGEVVAATNAELETALECLAAHLQHMAAAARTDGHRHVSALPPAVVVALWEQVMPYVHRCVHKGEASPPPLQPRLEEMDGGAHECASEAETSVLGDVEDATTELRDGTDTLTSSTAASKTLAVSANSVKKSAYVSLRRALSLHTRRIASLLPPPALALVLTRMYHCGALADDILGPIVADHMEALRRSASDHATSHGNSISALRQRVLRLPDGVRRGDGRDAAPPVAGFTGAAAVTVARLLGRAAIPGHHQLHRFFHLALLPEVTRVLACAVERAVQSAADEATGEAAEVPPGADALLDLTAALRHYAVSGHAVTHLTTLWIMHFADRQCQGDAAAALFVECAALLRAVSSAPSASNRTQRRRARHISPDGSHGGLSATQQRRRLLEVTEGDYYPLVDVACAQVCRLCSHVQSCADTSNTAALASTQLLALLCLVMRVNSPHWAETYEALASAALAALTCAAASLAAAAPSRSEEEVLEQLLPLSDARRTLNALLHRDSLIPDHPLHRVLLRRLLYSPAAMTDTAVASQVLLGLELMVPVEVRSAQADEGSAATTAAPAVTDDSSRSNDALTAATAALNPSADPTEALVTAALGTAAKRLLSTVVITPDDRHRALQVFRRLGRSLKPTAFMAGLCVVPLDTLPHTAQVAVVNHLTSVASAVSPSYLVKGMEAVVRQLPSSVVDDVSVQHWFSRFTARDVARRIDPVGCAVLLNILSSNPRYQRNCALAKECITHRIGVALRQTGEDGASGAVAGAVSLETLPYVVTSLQRANVFLPQYYSRACRLLLGQVEQASLGEILESFAVVAEAYMSRQRSEAQASVFKDVWELLRGRVMEEAGRLTARETLTAINAFAALDVTDKALFGVLVHQLWACLRTAEAAVADAAATTSNGAEAAEAHVHRRVQAAQHVLHALTPSAVAVVTTVLFARSDARASGAAQAHGATAVGGVGKGEDEDGSLVGSLLPWMLLALRNRHTELYPVDVLHLMPSLLEHYAAAAAVEDPSAPSGHGDRHAGLLHAAYDACRNTFLLMYALLPDTVTATQQPLLPVAEQQRIAEQRAQWTPATKLSVEVVPRPWFASLLVSLSSATLLDDAVALACVRRACTRRVCGSLLPISQLVDVCLSLCWLTTSTGLSATANTASASATARSSKGAQAPATPPVTCADDLSSSSSSSPSSAPPTPGAVLRSAMATVLSALWKRSDELTSAQISALLRCLRDTYGAEKVDADFVERLEAQKALLLVRGQQMRSSAAPASPLSEAKASNGSGGVASDVASPQQQKPKPVAQVDAEDLFNTM
ncbi:hypothetical protein Q4I28_000605 [Leishmania naiffi]|uniref:Sister chromatid cohesion protein n=1 Tax=Leishmania naiffi TaxID=5678 RepID=A0AAW3C7T6_9TRYP